MLYSGSPSKLYVQFVLSEAFVDFSITVSSPILPVRLIVIDSGLPYLLFLSSQVFVPLTVTSFGLWVLTIMFLLFSS